MSLKYDDFLKESMNQKTTDELLLIWTENKKNELREDAFSAISDILTGRGITPPKQNIAPPPKQNVSTPPASPKISLRRKRFIKALILLFISIIIITIRIKNNLSGASPLLDTFQTGVLFAFITYFIMGCFTKSRKPNNDENNSK